MSSYGPLCTEFYDLDKPDAPMDAVRYYAERSTERGGHVLEPMCGSGRFLLPMLRLGIQVEGVDAAPSMLGACRRRARGEGLSPTIYEQPLQSLSLPRKYSMAFIPSGSIGLIDSDSDLRLALKALHRHLAPRSPLLLELVTFGNEEIAEPQPLPRVVRCDDDSTVTYSCRIARGSDRSSLIFMGRYEKHHNSRLIAHEEEDIVLRQHRPEYMLQLLARCGFSLARVLGSDAYPGLHDSGCTLIEAHADAS